MNRVNNDYLNIIKQIVLKNVPLDEFAVFLFGSRAAGNAHQMSDIDIGFLGSTNLPLMIKAEIEIEIDESIVPFRVDLIDFYQVDPDFKKKSFKKHYCMELFEKFEIELSNLTQAVSTFYKGISQEQDFFDDITQDLIKMGKSKNLNIVRSLPGK